MRRVGLLALVGLAMTACSGGGVVSIKDPGPVPETTTSTEINYGAIALKGVSGRTATSVALGPGKASLSGTVTGPEGLLAGATVKIERLVGTGAASTMLTSSEEGTWALPDILGGRYRVRAWKAPELALTKPEVFFIQSSEAKTVNLRVDRHAGIGATASTAPSPPYYGVPANLFVLVANKTVDENGFVQSVPIVGATVHLSGSGVSLETGNPSTSDQNGVASWRVRCTVYGKPTLFVSVEDSGTLPIDVPACVDPNAPPTTSASSSSTTRTTSRTSTTRR